MFERDDENIQSYITGPKCCSIPTRNSSLRADFVSEEHSKIKCSTMFSQHAFIPVKMFLFLEFLFNELKKRVRILKENLEEYVFVC